MEAASLAAAAAAVCVARRCDSAVGGIVVGRISGVGRIQAAVLVFGRREVRDAGMWRRGWYLMVPVCFRCCLQIVGGAKLRANGGEIRSCRPV